MMISAIIYIVLLALVGFQYQTKIGVALEKKPRCYPEQLNTICWKITSTLGATQVVAILITVAVHCVKARNTHWV